MQEAKEVHVDLGALLRCHLLMIMINQDFSLIQISIDYPFLVPIIMISPTLSQSPYVDYIN